MTGCIDRETFLVPGFRLRGRNKSLVFLFLLLLLFPACWRCDPPATIDRGKIPDSILAYNPYRNGQSLKFRHSGGLVIEFATSRESHEQWMRCERCCKYEYKYEENTTTLTPDYPIFNFVFELSNRDSLFFDFAARVGPYLFYIPSNKYQSGYCGFADSLLIDKKYYKDVFKIKSIYGSAYDKDPIFADSIYYSYKDGLIQVMMSNGEKYSVYE